MAKQLCIPRAWLVRFLGYIVEVVRSVVKHLGDDEGAFPGRGQFMRPLLIHSKNQVSLLECPSSVVPGMEST